MFISRSKLFANSIVLSLLIIVILIIIMITQEVYGHPKISCTMKTLIMFKSVA